MYTGTTTAIVYNGPATFAKLDIETGVWMFETFESNQIIESELFLQLIHYQFLIEE